MLIKPIDLDAAKQALPKLNKPIPLINKYDYCLHGKSIKNNSINLGVCSCCGSFIKRDEEILQLRYCQWCRTTEVKKEFL
jgi:hypothetical protein